MLSPELEIEMSTNNDNKTLDAQRDARAWSRFTGTKYTAALRQMTSPLAQGFLGERVSARDLLNVLDEHPLFSKATRTLGENGLDDDAWHFNGQTDYIELALIADVLRMFTPERATVDGKVGSYTLKHTAEKFLDPHVSYVSNGRLIWVAAALGLNLVPQSATSPNVEVGVSEAEHHYLWRLLERSAPNPRGDHYRPTGLSHLQDALARCTAGETPPERWVQPPTNATAAPFHDWLTQQAERRDPIGDLARDYVAGIHDSDHGIAGRPGDLLQILSDVSASSSAYDASVAAIAEWFAARPASEPVRTQLVRSDVREVPGYGAGSGDMERLEYECPCGDGSIVEEHDNIPGFRDHSVWIECDRCSTSWGFAPGRSTRNWGLLPTAPAA